MKQFINNNLKVFVTLIISAIVFTGVGIYASQYLAKDISFTPADENFKKSNGETVDNEPQILNYTYNENINTNVFIYYTSGNSQFGAIQTQYFSIDDSGILFAGIPAWNQLLNKCDVWWTACRE